MEADGFGARSWHLGASKAAYGRVWGGVWLAHAPWTAPPTSRCYKIDGSDANFPLQKNNPMYGYSPDGTNYIAEHRHERTNDCRRQAGQITTPVAPKHPRETAVHL